MNHVEMMRLAESVALQSVCKRAQVGAVVVYENGRIKTGFNHNNGKCCEGDDGRTLPSVIHAEMVATGQHLSPLLWGNVMGFKVLYVTRQPCIKCAQLITQTGIKSVYYRDVDDKMDGLHWLRLCGISVFNEWIDDQPQAVLERVQRTWADRWQGVQP
jgi:dCMP deaminase